MNVPSHLRKADCWQASSCATTLGSRPLRITRHTPSSQHMEKAKFLGSTLDQRWINVQISHCAIVAFAGNNPWPTLETIAAGMFGLQALYAVYPWKKWSH